MEIATSIFKPFFLSYHKGRVYLVLFYLCKPLLTSSMSLEVQNFDRQWHFKVSFLYYMFLQILFLV